MGKRRNKKLGGNRGPRTNYSELMKENEKYERYYNGLQIVSEPERKAFWEALRRDLPNSFRFTGSRCHALAVQERLKDFYIPKITSITHDGKPVEPPRPIPWYPDQLAWSMATPRTVIRRFAPFESFQKFLVAETEVGNISRQEVVSMIPPLLLDVRPGMTVLDMCAAPGSKSAQLMEMVHRGEEERMQKIAKIFENGAEAGREENSLNISNSFVGDIEPDVLADDGRSTGLLIANDSDYKRAHLLIHQMKRLNSPNLLVTNHDATSYPSIRLPPKTATNDKAMRKTYLKFDRILADVPCSGDGTARKNLNVWRDWNPANGLGLYVIQVRILVRALQMLKVGGRVVYSTCSMNPIENEAVVASAVDRCGGSGKIRLINCTDELPGLKRSPGLRSWTVMDKQGKIWNSWEDVDEEISRGDGSLNKIVEGMFPPVPEDEEIDLTRCIRIYPHQQDTGAFFIAVLEKKCEIKATPEVTKRYATNSAFTTGNEPDPLQQDGTEQPFQKANVPGDSASQALDQETATLNVQSTPQKRNSNHLENGPLNKRSKVLDRTSAVPEDRTKAQNGDNSSAETVAEVVMDSARSQPCESSVSRPQKAKSGQTLEEPFKYLDSAHEELEKIFNFYEISPPFPRDRFMVRNALGRPAKTIYYTSVLARDILTENEGTGLKFVHCGVKMFVKQDVQREDVCPWRIQKDGLSILDLWIGKDRVVKLYKKETLRKLLTEMFPKVSGDSWKKLGEIGEWVRDVDMGCCVLRVEPTEAEDGFRERMVLPLWRSLYSLNLMLPKEERRAMLLRIFDDDTPLVNPTKKREALSTLHTDQMVGDAPDSPNGHNEGSNGGTTEVEEAGYMTGKAADVIK